MLMSDEPMVLSMGFPDTQIELKRDCDTITHCENDTRNNRFVLQYITMS